MEASAGLRHRDVVLDISGQIHAAQLGARKLSLRVLGGNSRARRLYEACGFVVEGILRSEFLLGGRYVDDIFMARHLVNEEPFPQATTSGPFPASYRLDA